MKPVISRCRQSPCCALSPIQLSAYYQLLGAVGEDSRTAKAVGHKRARDHRMHGEAGTSNGAAAQRQSSQQQPLRSISGPIPWIAPMPLRLES